MYIGNIMLLIINIAFIPFIVLFMEKVKAYMPLIILLLSVFGVYSYRNMLFDVIVMLIAGIVGYLMNKLDFPPAPVILGLILGGMTENSLRQSLDLSNGNVSIFFTRPIALAFLSLAMALVLCNGWQMYRQKNRMEVENDN
jgi:putative tricarboxylic transport membrane protein